MKYRIHGLVLESNIELPGLTCVGKPEKADVTFNVAAIPRSVSHDLPEDLRTVAVTHSDGSCFVELFDLPSGYVMLFRGVVQFNVSRDGSCVECFSEIDFPEGVLKQYLLGWVFSLIIQLRDMGGLHCSVVEFDGEAIAFVGSSGAGKSTMVTALCMAGRKLLTDEVMVYALENDIAYALPGYREIRLTPESLAELKLRFDVEGISERDDHGKVAVAPDDIWGKIQPDRLPLRCLYILTGEEPSDSGNVEIRRIDPKDAPRELLRHTFVIPKYHKEFLNLQFSLLCNLASRIPIFWLTHPRDINQLPAVIDVLIDHQSRLEAEELVAPALTV